MLHDWGVIAAAFGYIGFLFLVASHGDRVSPTQRGRASTLIYPLSLAIYCTSWTFFGSVGFATRTSVDFLAIYIGPILMIGLCTPLLRRVIQLAKSQRITSIADFIAARYGKSQAVAATVALIAIVGSVPYIALQLKAAAASLETILSEDQAVSHVPIIGDIALMVTLAMATFAVLFGTRQSDATEHQHGLMLAVATESIVKLVAFIAAGAFVTFWMFDPHDLIQRAMKTPEAVRAINYTPSIGNFLCMVALSFCAIVLLPRQFHVSAVENSSDPEVSRARWLFPLYLVAINLFVIPIAIAGLVTFPFGAVDSDMYVLALPIVGKAPLLSIAGHDVRAVEYLIGNHVIAETMFRHDAKALLYAPLRMLVYSDADGNAVFTMDQPSAAFGSLGIPEVTEVGEGLDDKVSNLLRVAGVDAADAFRRELA